VLPVRFQSTAAVKPADAAGSPIGCQRRLEELCHEAAEVAVHLLCRANAKSPSTRATPAARLRRTPSNSPPSPISTAWALMPCNDPARHRPYHTSVPLGLNLHQRPIGRCHPPVGPESLGPSPPCPAAQGTDGEGTGPTRPAGLLARISMSGPRAAATPGRARVPRAVPASPGRPGNGR
jgi:hypothetical protein